MQQNHEQNIYTLVFLLKEKTALNEKWIYTIKLNENNRIAWYKTKWVIKKFQQHKEINYDQIYTSVMKDSMIHIFFAVIVVKNWFVKQINFITVFLNRILSDDEIIYMKQLISYESKTNLQLICQLNQDLYDLKQCVKIWYDTFI